MDKVRQLRRNEIQALDLVLLARKRENLYFVGLDASSEYYLKPLTYCRMDEIYKMLKDERPLIEIYGGKEEEDE